MLCGVFVGDGALEVEEIHDAAAHGLWGRELGGLLGDYVVDGCEAVVGGCRYHGCGSCAWPAGLAGWLVENYRARRRFAARRAASVNTPLSRRSSSVTRSRSGS